MLIKAMYPIRYKNATKSVVQSQKTQGFRVADFATLSDERRSSLKFSYCLIWINEPCVRKFEGLGFHKLSSCQK